MIELVGLDEPATNEADESRAEVEAAFEFEPNTAEGRAEPEPDARADAEPDVFNEA